MTAARIPLGDAAARLERRVGLAMLCEARLDHAGCPGKRRFEVAGREALPRYEVGLMLRIDRCGG
jgi:hypothetical protein